jgi:hypothetical protein
MSEGFTNTLFPSAALGNNMDWVLRASGRSGWFPHSYGWCFGSGACLTHNTMCRHVAEENLHDTQTQRHYYN